MTERPPRSPRAAARIDLSVGDQKLLTTAWLGAVYVGCWLLLTPPVAPSAPLPKSPPTRVVVKAAEPVRARSAPARAPRLRTRSS
jgi:hypothetical protein